MIDVIYNWLKAYPGMEGIRLDRVEEIQGGTGMFYRGTTVPERCRNLLGQIRERKRVIFRIRRFDQRSECAPYFLELGDWVRENPPVFGLDQTVCLRDAHCLRDDGLGLALWEADLEITFTEEDVCAL